MFLMNGSSIKIKDSNILIPHCGNNDVVRVLFNNSLYLIGKRIIDIILKVSDQKLSNITGSHYEIYGK